MWIQMQWPRWPAQELHVAKRSFEVFGKEQFVRRLTIFSCLAISFSSQLVLAQQLELPVPSPRSVDRLALVGDVVEPIPNSSAVSEPMPFASSVLASDSIPPFAAHPDLNVAMPVSYAQPVPQEAAEPVSANSDEPTETIDDCCRELTAMIAGNLDSEISNEAKAKMIETALKMVARNVALQAEAEITQLKADHALEIARMNSQMMHMRSVANAADQINRVAGPLHQMLEKNYQQSVAMNHVNQQLSQMVAQIGMKKLEADARLARENRKRITLTSPPPKPLISTKQTASESRAEKIMREIDLLRQRLDAEYSNQQQEERVLPATYNQPLQPRSQPLEPIRRVNQYYKGGNATYNR